MSFSDALDKVIPREAREFVDKVIPNELKDYVGTAATLAIPYGGGIFGGAVGSFITDIIAQKLLYDEDADKDTDYLKALTSSVLGGAKAYNRTSPGIFDKLAGREGSGGFYGEGAKDRFVKPGTRGLMLDPSDPTDKTLMINEKADPRFLEPTNEGFLQMIGAKDATGPSIAQSTLDAKYRVGEGGFKEGLFNVFDAGMDAAEPFTSFKLDPNEAMGLDNISLGSVTSGLTGIQAGNTPSQVRDASKALEEAEARYQNYLNQLDADERASIEADRTARVAAYKKYMGLAGYSEEEINDALIQAGYLVEGNTAYAAQGGRIGFDVGGGTGARTDQMGIGNYIAAEQMRTDFTNDLQSGLLLAQANMREQEFKKDQIKKQMQDQRRNLFNDTVNMIDDRFADNREQRKMANMGGMMNAPMNIIDRPNFNYGSGRQTSQGDPIAPNVPPGKQMDLRPGGFIELGTKPKADDVPAMVGKNEFVLNDEAVSGIGKMITGKADPRAGARALYELQSQMESIV